MSRRSLLLTLLLVTILIASYAYLREVAVRVFSEAPQASEEAARARLSEQVLEHGVSTTQLVTLYFPSYENMVLAAEVREVALAKSETDRIRQVMLALIEGSQKGYGRVLSSSTAIRAVFLTTDGTAVLDLSSEALADLPAGITSETLIVYSIVNSLAQVVPAVKQVRILIQGQELETLGGHVDLTEPFVPDPSRVGNFP